MAVVHGCSTPTTRYKSLVISAISLLLLHDQYGLKSGIETFLVSCTGAYMIAKYINGPSMPWLAFTFLMSHLGINHIKRQVASDHNVADITGPQMILIMKMTAFCWNLHDGRQKAQSLTVYQKTKAISKMPRFVDFMAYALFFPSLLAGPTFEYKDYEQWLGRTTPDQTSHQREKTTSSPEHHHNISSLLPAIRKAVEGVAWILLFNQFSAWYNLKLVLSDTFDGNFFHYKVWIIVMLNLTRRLRYYGIWSLAEGACILSGLTYKGVDPKAGKAQWDRLNNVNPWGVETAQNSYDFLGNWNKNTKNWLRHYVYVRVTPPGTKPGFKSRLITFLVSALRHGFYPGYYLTFVLGACISHIAGCCRSRIRPSFVPHQKLAWTYKKVLYDVFSYLATHTMFAFTTIPFIALSLQHSLQIWASVNYYGIICVGLSMTFFLVDADVKLSSSHRKVTNAFKSRHWTSAVNKHAVPLY